MYKPAMCTLRSPSPNGPVLLGGHGRETIATHARREYPLECCGALLGSTSASGSRTITTVLPLNNVAPPAARRSRYELHPVDHLHAEKTARAQGLEVVGVYHSHPDGCSAPSERDRAEAMPHWSYLIVGYAPPNGASNPTTSMQCWRLRTDGSGFDEEALHTEI